MHVHTMTMINNHESPTLSFALSALSLEVGLVTALTAGGEKSWEPEMTTALLMPAVLRMTNVAVTLAQGLREESERERNFIMAFAMKWVERLVKSPDEKSIIELNEDMKAIKALFPNTPYL